MFPTLQLASKSPFTSPAKSRFPASTSKLAYAVVNSPSFISISPAPTSTESSSNSSCSGTSITTCKRCTPSPQYAAWKFSLIIKVPSSNAVSTSAFLEVVITLISLPFPLTTFNIPASISISSDFTSSGANAVSSVLSVPLSCPSQSVTSQ